MNVRLCPAYSIARRRFPEGPGWGCDPCRQSMPPVGRNCMPGLIAVALAASLAGGSCNKNTESPAPTPAAPEARQPQAAGPRTSAGEAGVPPLPDPSWEPPKVVPQAVLEAQRVAGEKNPVPGEADAEAMAASGKGTVGRFKMCLDDKGIPAKVIVLKSTNYPDYDARIKAGMRAWRYKPFLDKGKAVPVCTSVEIAYRPGTAASRRPSQ